MASLATPLQTTAAATDLISFLKALPDCRMRRGVRFPQWWMLLVAILATGPNFNTNFAALGLPVRKVLIPSPCPNEIYEARMGEACAALLSDWFPATTGEIVHVDGGVHSQGA